MHQDRLPTQYEASSTWADASLADASLPPLPGLSNRLWQGRIGAVVAAACGMIAGCDRTNDASGLMIPVSSPTPAPLVELDSLQLPVASNYVLTQPYREVATPGTTTDALPLPLSQAAVMCVDPATGREVYRINIFREDPNYSAGQDKAPKRHHIYYHAPYGGFVETAAPLEGMPKIVHKVSGLLPDGTRVVELKLSTTSDEVRRVCKEAIIQQDRSYALQEGLSEKDIIVESWPLTHAAVVVRHTMLDRVLCWAETGELKSSPEITVRLRVADTDYATLIEGIAHDEVEFTFHFQARGNRTVAANSEMRGSISVADSVNANLTSAQRSGTAPIFQSDRQRVVQHVNESLTRTVRTQDVTLLPILNSAALEARVFEGLQRYDLNALKREYKQASEAFNAFIRPHLETFREEMARQNVIIKIDEDESVSNRSKGGGVSFLGFGKKSGSSVTERDLSRLEKATGVQFRYDTASERFVPHSITVTKLKEGWQSVEISAQDTVFLSVGQENRYLPESPLSPSFTQSRASELLTTSKHWPHERDSYRKEIAELKSQVKKLQGQRDTFKKERDTFKKERDAARKERDTFKKQRDTYKRERDEARKRLRNLPPRVLGFGHRH